MSKGEMSPVTPFLTFAGQAEEAMNLYTSVFENSEIIRITRYGPNEPGEEGSVMHASFSLNGQVFMCIDSNIKHDWTFTPAISLYTAFENEEEIQRVYEELSRGGQILMPLGSYPFSKMFGWISDRYGVTWQLQLNES
ncbi:VOC family protein [Paenibacillus sp. UNC499MF]|uniref:VOC family protein n=1 Tax=Paenibacillus sp. UNC499MF TaxID=1502751 RepID=UPI00089FEFF2|nr:VOC family protein [Paenibacillus sp. UNC499MF]SEG66807.1 Glyoxalase superfamily enzyme, possibly 3-demethylubiquinone-9 3-methyltransferase [Paenibacillus sp. UNC499MF]